MHGCFEFSKTASAKIFNIYDRVKGRGKTEIERTWIAFGTIQKENLLQFGISIITEPMCVDAFTVSPAVMTVIFLTVLLLKMFSVPSYR